MSSVWQCEDSDRTSFSQSCCDSIQQRHQWLVPHCCHFVAFFCLCFYDEIQLSPCVSGELAGHRDLVSGFSFCQHAGQSHVCVSSSNDGSIRFWDSDNKVLIKEHAAHQVSVDCLVSLRQGNRNNVLSSPAGCSQFCTSSKGWEQEAVFSFLKMKQSFSSCQILYKRCCR